MVGLFCGKMIQITPKGTKDEQLTFEKCRSHYDRSRHDLDVRKQDFDKKDELFRTYIDEAKWPYKAQVADPSVFTFIIEKTSRLISNKLRGVVKPRGGSDWLKAKVNNELLDYQWDLANEGGSMIQKWALMDHNTRKYGSAFGLCRWNYQTEPGKTEPIADNPEFEVIANRDFLYNPDHPEIRRWAQVRGYFTLDELKNTNDFSRTGPKYKNLDILEQANKEESSVSDRRDNNYISRNKSIKGLTDTLGEDKYDKYIEIVTEYTPTRIIKFSPRHGVVILDQDNPYGEIPIVHLKYYVIDDDLYGLSEIEPIEKLQRVENALISQYLDTVNTDLYPPLMVRAAGVQLHTLEFGPNKKWLMQNPGQDVMRFATSTAATTQFTSTVSFIISRMQKAVGETSEGLSNVNPMGGDKTATEVKDSGMQRMARDNFNQIFLSEALKRQMLLWMKMNAKYINKDLILRITENNSLATLKDNMLVKPPAPQLDPMTGQAMPTLDPITGQPATPSPFGMNDQAEWGQGEPVYPVTNGKEVKPKFKMDESGDTGELVVEPKDLDGIYDYIPDVESMSLQQNDQSKMKMQLLTILLNPAVTQQLAAEQQKPKIAELLTETMEDLGFKDAKRFFEQVDQSQLQQMGGINEAQAGQVIPGAGATSQGVVPGSPNGPVGGVQPNSTPNPIGQAQPVVP
jgi:hypothetical protein